MNLLEELDRTIKLLESKVPASPSSPQNEKLEKALEQDMADYFRRLDDALDRTRLEQIYYKYAVVQ